MKMGMDLPPKTQTEHATTIIAITAPFDRAKEPESDPAAPASESPDPDVLLTSPALGSLGCSGVVVARVEKRDATALAVFEGRTDDMFARGGYRSQVLYYSNVE